MKPAPTAPPRFAVGIDLGTTNSARAFADLAGGGGIEDFRHALRTSRKVGGNDDAAWSAVATFVDTENRMRIEPDGFAHHRHNAAQPGLRWEAFR